MSYEERLTKLEARVDRDYRHLERLLLTQRQLVEKAFDDVKLALMEMDLGIRAHGASTRENLHELTETLKEVTGSMLEQHDEIEDIKRRLDRLESPPAA